MSDKNHYFYIEDADDFIWSFEDREHFREWLYDAHEEYEFEEITELKQLCLDNELDEFYMVCKQFEYEML